MEDQNIIKLDLGGDKIIVLKITNFDTDVDTDDILKIDFSNILGEILTFSVIYNRIGILRAEMENIVKRAEFDLEIYRANLEERLRKSLSRKENYYRKDGTKIVEPTSTEITNNVFMDEGFQNKKSVFFRLKKEFSYVENLYWSAKSKDDKLNKISEKITPSEFEKELIGDKINGIIIKSCEKLIK